MGHPNRAVRLVGTLLMAGLWISGCGPRRRPSVLLVTIDTLRADAVDSQPGLTPALHALAEAGTTFTRATAVTPLTLPSHASLLTGVRPARHGLTVNGLSVPSLPTETLAEALSRVAYDTAAFVSSAMLDRRHGLDRGFEHYDDELYLAGGPSRPHERRGDRTVDRALDWIVDRREPWFAWVHLYDPHAPYEAPGGRSEPARAAYLDEVAFADTQLGRLLAAVEGSGQPVLVVVTSDHGEGLGEHGEQTHGLLLYESTLHVPLILARLGPGRVGFPEAGQLRNDVVSLLDVTPTILEILGLSASTGLDGRSMVAPLPPRNLPLEARAGWFYYGFSALAGVRHGELKLVGAPDADPAHWTLHDLSQDPAELDGEDGEQHPLRGAILSTAPVQQATSVDSDAALRALGYVGPGGPPGALTIRRDPRQSMDLVEALDEANTLLVQGHPGPALALLEAQRHDYHDVAELQLFLGKAARALGRADLARKALERALELQPASLGALHELAKVRLEQGSESAVGPADVPPLLSRAEALVPGDADTAALSALYEVLFGDPARALERLGPALAEHPRALNLLQVRVRALRALGREAEAEAVESRLRAGGGGN